MGMISGHSKSEIRREKEEAICNYLNQVIFNFEDEAAVEKIRKMLKETSKRPRKGNK